MFLATDMDSLKTDWKGMDYEQAEWIKNTLENIQTDYTTHQKKKPQKTKQNPKNKNKPIKKWEEDLIDSSPRKKYKWPIGT